MAGYAPNHMTAQDFIDTNITPNLSYAWQWTKETGRSLAASTPGSYFQAGAGILAALATFSLATKLTGAGNHTGITGMVMNLALYALSGFLAYAGFKGAFNASAGLQDRIVNGSQAAPAESSRDTEWVPAPAP